MEYLYFMGAKIDIEEVIGIGPLCFTEGIAGGVEFRELSFELLLVNYPFPFSSGKIRPQPWVDNPEEKLKEFRRQYNMLSEGMDRYLDTGQLMQELSSTVHGKRESTADWVGSSFIITTDDREIYEIMYRVEPDKPSSYLVSIRQYSVDAPVRAHRYVTDPPNTLEKARSWLTSYLAEKQTNV